MRWLSLARALRAGLGRLLRGRRFATGGRLPARLPDPDRLPCLISPGRSTTLRPGETLLEATERLTEGRDL